MRAWLRSFALIVAATSLSFGVSALGIESSALPLAQNLPPEVQQVATCGQWKVGKDSGYYRFIVVTVSGGAGTEVYVQKIEIANATSSSLRILETTTFPQLNNDHSQYYFDTARCGQSGHRHFVELTGTYEHDEEDVEHLVRIYLDPSMPYRVTNKTRKRGSQK